MKIYVVHSTSMNYIDELYNPLKESKLAFENEIIFPHDKNQNINSKEIISNSDLVIAEVSYPSVGMGIELGWAEDRNVKIVCINKINTKVSSALKFITNDFIEYKDTNDLIQKLEEYINLNK